MRLKIRPNLLLPIALSGPLLIVFILLLMILIPRNAPSRQPQYNFVYTLDDNSYSNENCAPPHFEIDTNGKVVNRNFDEEADPLDTNDGEYCNSEIFDNTNFYIYETDTRESTKLTIEMVNKKYSLYQKIVAPDGFEVIKAEDEKDLLTIFPNLAYTSGGVYLSNNYAVWEVELDNTRNIHRFNFLGWITN